ncbi:D-alanine--D-alanine ligase [Tuanshanicoccus lijuaniae]|uniref:D-alanine--D-alanine ligase n=1 Tax=Aerococcaceae bacterium zg-1292 TaxID=2774330 RepID=UPI0019376629|nr:D-alanine--D-alanine ligase [Aerococcaceae bacterium zg-1292]MBF6626114.1 D-alanine--D-alanine ligase [Aerococcaceae bacterium zg-BR9]MBF6978796.1 D-alanine--D-alanine ligase [Aerococcaceae bacterium zg-BR22]QQA36723.1 D-alanine--D-alanine ligase [Aerococcaceae bacterium zg-1292]
MKIILLYGGQSAEHDVSIISAFNITQHIMYHYYQVQPIFIRRDGVWIKGAPLTSPLQASQQLILTAGETAQWSDHPEQTSIGVEIHPGSIYESDAIVFPVLHGPNGEDGTIQGFLEVLKMPYVGAGVVASAAGMDKIVSKYIFNQVGLPQVPFEAFDRQSWASEQEAIIQKCEGNLLYPLFVKPANMGSSVGISRVENSEELRAAVETALKFDHRIVVEQGIIADEVEVAVLGNDDAHVSVVGKLVKDTAFYDYDNKYLNNSVSMQIPAEIPESVAQKIQSYALTAYRAINGRGLSRVDFFVTANNDIYINEINTMPGFTPYSMYPVLWKETGLDTRDLVEELLQLALKQFEVKQLLTVERI